MHFNEENASAIQAGSINVRPDRPRPVSEGLDFISKEIEMLDRAVTQMIERLSPVIGPPRPEPVDPDGQDSEEKSELAFRLETQAGQIRRIRNILFETYGRLEL